MTARCVPFIIAKLSLNSIQSTELGTTQLKLVPDFFFPLIKCEQLQWTITFSLFLEVQNMIIKTKIQERIHLLEVRKTTL